MPPLIALSHPTVWETSVGYDIERGVVAGKFELYKDRAGKFRFRLKARNGEIIASSEAYETKVSAKNGIKSVQRNAPTATIDDQT